MEKKQTILAFDTAMAGLSVGVIGANGNIVSRQIETQREQASLLVPLIQEVLDEAHLGFNDIDLIGVTRGPGSFTGLRIGLTTAKVMGLSLDKPVIGVGTLDVMAQHYLPYMGADDETLLVVLETKRQHFYAQYFTNNDTNKPEITEPFSGSKEQILERVTASHIQVGGDCLQRFEGDASGGSSVECTYLDAWIHPDSILIAQCALARYESGAYDANIDPLYLRDADVSFPKNKPRHLKDA